MENSWLMLLKADRRVHGGNLGYDDVVDESYTWNNTVPNYNGPAPGDGIVIWDSETLLGASIIETIKTETEEKPRRRCPICNSTDIRERTTKTPQFKCGRQSCRAEFQNSIDEDIKVETFRTSHEVAWQDLSGHLDGKVLRSLCEHPKSQHSIRKFRWEEFVKCLDKTEVRKFRSISSAIDSWRSGGRKKSFTKVRIGQDRFRKDLIAKFGAVCAFMGSTPMQALEAAHLYSYSSFEKHFDGGGILLRRDLHRLFDFGLIAVNPVTLKLDLEPELRKYPQYVDLHKASLSVTLSQKEVRWLKVHWNEHRQQQDKGTTGQIQEFL